MNGHTKEEEEEDHEEEAAARPKPGVKVHLTPFELEGLWNLLGKLESLPAHKQCVPAGIHNAPALLHHIRVGGGEGGGRRKEMRMCISRASSKIRTVCVCVTVCVFPRPC